MKQTKLLGKSFLIFLFIAIICFSAILTACEFIGGDGSGDNQEITFDNIVFKDGSKTIEVKGHPIPSNFIPEKEGYTFQYWITDLGNKNSVFEQNEYDGKPITLYAVWKAKKYNVKFVDHDGSVIQVDGKDEQTVEYDSSAKAPKDPERYGYTFTGWDVSFSQIKKDTVVTATYERTATTVSFYYENQLLAQKQLYIGDKIDVCVQEALDGLAGFTSSGLEVEGWYSDASYTDKLTISTATAVENMNVYAKLKVAQNKTLSLTTDGVNNVFEYSESLSVRVTLNYTEYASISYSIKWYVDGVAISDDASVITVSDLNVGSHVIKAELKSTFEGMIIVDEKSVTVVVNKATLIVKPDEMSISYGDSLTVSNFDVKNANGVVLGTATISTNYKVGDPVGTYTLSASDFENSVYNLVFQTSTLTVKPRNVTVKAVDDSIEYGSKAPSFKYEPSSIVGNDNLGNATFSCLYEVGNSVGEYKISVSGLSNPNYNVTEYIDGTLTVTKMKISFKIVCDNISYGDDVPEFSYKITKGEVLDGDSLDTARFYTNYEKGNEVGSYNIRMSGLKNDNYEIPQTTLATFHVLPKSVRLNWTYSNSYQYNGADQSNTVGATFTDIEGVTLSASIVFSGASDSFKNAGEYSVNATIDNKNYNLTNGTLTLKIAKKQAVVKVSDKTIVYGDDVPDYEYTIDGICSGDSLGTLTFVCDYKTGSNVGNYSLIATGLSNDNYEISYNNGLLTVEKRAVDVSWQMNDSYEYNGAIQSDTIYAKYVRYDGKYTTLVLSYKLGEVVSDFKNAGTYKVVAENKDDNYLLSDTEKTITIAPKDVHIVFDSKEITFGDDAPDYSHEIQGLVSGETPSTLGKLAYVCEYQKGSNAGVYAISGQNLTNSNYNIIYDSANLTVNKMTVKANWLFADSYVYNGENQGESVSCTFTGYTGDIENMSVAFASGVYTEFYHAGEYTVSSSSEAEINYEVSDKVISLTIAQKSVDVVADPFELVYGDNKPVYTSKINGLCSGDSLGEVVYTCAYAVGSPVGKYDIELSGCANDDYKIQYTSAVLNCDYRKINLTWDYLSEYVYSKADQSETVKATFTAYDGTTVDASLSFASLGNNVFVNAGNYVVTASCENTNYVLLNNVENITVQPKACEITVADVIATYGDESVDFIVNKVGVFEGDVIETTVLFEYKQGLTTVGAYDLNVQYQNNPNYSVTVNKGILTVQKLVVGVVWSIDEIVYNGLTRKDSVVATFTAYDGEVKQMNVAFDGKDAQFKNAGVYNLSASFDNENYDYTNTSTSATIEKKDLVIDVDEKSIEYGDEITFTYTANGLISGDSLGDYSFVCDYVVGSPVNKYAIVMQNVANDNYNITVNENVLKVNPKNVTLSWIYSSLVYNGSNQVDSVKCVYNDYQGSVVEMALSVSGDYTEFKNAGAYTFTASYSDSNYNVNGEKVKVISIAKADYSGIRHGDLKGTYNPDKHLSDYDLGENFAWQNALIVPTVNVTEYRAVYNADKINYNDYALTVSLTLAKATFSGVTIHSALSGVYSPDKHLSDYTLSDYYFWANPDILPTVDVVTYQAFYNSDRVNYEDYPTTVTVNLAKADYVGIIHGDLTGTYNPDKHLSDYDLSQNYVWKDSSIVPTVNRATYTAVYNADKVNYNDFELNVRLNLAKADYVGITHGGFTGKYNPDKHLSDYALNENYAWQNASIVPTVNVTEYKAIYNADKDNYNDFVLSVGIKLEKATYSGITHGVVTGTYDPDKTLASYTLSAGYRWSNSSEVPVVTKTTYNAYYNGDSVNYVDFALTITLKLAKATATLSQTTWSFDYTQQGSSFVPTVKFNNKVVDSSNYTLAYSNGNSFVVGGVYKTTVTMSSQNYQLNATECTVKIKSVVVGTSSTLQTLEDALANTSSGNVIIKYPTRLNNNATVKSGVTLLVPYSAEHDATLVPGISGQENVNLGSVYVTLTISENVELIVNGTLNVSAKQFGGSSDYIGHTSGNYGELILENNSFVDVYGKIYSSGYVIGSGEIYVNGGAEAHELLAIKDWGGGNAAYTVYEKIFPFTQFSISNVEAKMTVVYNAKLLAHYYLIASDKDFKGELVMFGSGGLFEITDSVNGSVEKVVDPTTGRIKITSHGGVKTNNISISISIKIIVNITVKMDTNGKEVPICGFYDIVVGSDSTVSLNTRFRLLPGSSFTIEKGGVCNISSSGGLIGYTTSYSGLYSGVVTRGYGGSISKAQTRLQKTVYQSSSAVSMVINGTLNSSGMFGGNVTTNVQGSILNLTSATVSGSINSSCKLSQTAKLMSIDTMITYAYSVVSNGVTLGKAKYTGNAQGYFA